MCAEEEGNKLEHGGQSLHLSRFAVSPAALSTQYTCGATTHLTKSADITYFSLAGPFLYSYYGLKQPSTNRKFLSCALCDIP